MIKKLFFKLGYIPIKDVETEINRLSKEIDSIVPSVKWKDGDKNIIFFKERDLIHRFIHKLYELKVDLKYYYMPPFTIGKKGQPGYLVINFKKDTKIK